MIDKFIAYFRHACPEILSRPLVENLEETVGHRSLPTFATLPFDMKLPDSVSARVKLEEQRVKRYRALEKQLDELTDGAARAIKGSRFSAFYPEGVLRYQGDLDLLVTTERAYIRCVEQLLEMGLVQKSSHLTLASDGEHYASSIFFEPLIDGQPGPESIYAELHLKGFPITPLSYLDMTSAAFRDLSQDSQNALTYVAELAHRYAKFSQFTHRDVLDSMLLFSRLDAKDLESLREAIGRNVLWVSVSLLGRHLRNVAPPGLPSALLELINDKQAGDPPESYDLFEHQAWPFCRQGGMSRDEYEYLHSAYGEINVAAGDPYSLTPFEVGLRFGRGVPVAMQIVPTPGSSAILDSCVVLAGPANARVPVHQRIGDFSPSPPQ